MIKIFRQRDIKYSNQKYGKQSGFALVLTLVVMAAMTAIGLAALTNSTTDLLITRNEKEARLAFTLAEIGIDEALSRMSLPYFWPDQDTFNLRRVGEKTEDKINRTINARPLGGILPQFFDSWPSSSPGAVEVIGIREEDIGGSYEVSIDYTFESEDPYTWCSEAIGLYDPGCTNPPDIVLFCSSFGFRGGGALRVCDEAEPVYEIISKGKTKAGTEAVVKVYVSASSLNVVPPGSSILFSERQIKLGNTNVKVSGATAGTLGQVAARNIDEDDTAAGIKGNTLTSRITNGCGSGATANCNDISDLNPPIPEIASWDDEDFDDYLGLPYKDLKGYADYKDSHLGSSTKDIPDEELGTICDSASADESAHISCDHGQSKILYLDNRDGAKYSMTGGATGRGILIVTGDLHLSGNVVYEGFIYVVGNLTTTGTNVIWGAIMVKGRLNEDPAIWLKGDVTIDGSVPVASSVASSLGISKTLRWQRQ